MSVAAAQQTGPDVPAQPEPQGFDLDLVRMALVRGFIALVGPFAIDM